MMRRTFFLFILLAVTSVTVFAQADKADEYLQAARKLRKEGKCTEALPLFKKAIETKPTLAAAHYELGWCYNEMQQYEQALPVLETALKLDPANFRIIYESGFAQYKLGKTEVALQNFNRVLQMNGSFTKAYIARGDLYKDVQKNTNAALTDFLKAFSIDSTEKKLHYRIGWCYNDLGKYNEALPYLQKAISFEEQNYLSHSELGFTLFSLNRYDEAIVCLQKANSLKAGFETTVYYLGLCFVKKQKKQEAVQKYNELVQLNSNYAPELLKGIKEMN
ncbi:tetratricopeptide repeat protein [Lacibacter luteus]|uniref:Tetratricopeptide repeat protein n=1 Tax=Lacibacter luteus TaxID=2508719 RepID=A0A4Q1CFG6_9BACT|nr:tetratricopeptide repeat protein [Lacibacter luteus]RXK58756.1 tetratricopeptide repeat protein [Lacibacter luteus]